MVFRTKTTQLITALLTALAMLLLPAAFSVAAQDGEETVLLRAWACPDASPADPFTECEAIVGATYRIEANGAEIAESPVTTVRETGIGPGVDFSVPAGADLTITQLSGAPGGYVPAPGFDPFTTNVADLPQVGFGGESTGPGVNFINIPADTDGDDDTGGDDGTNGETNDTDGAGESDRQGTTTLPETGTGPADVADRQVAVASLLIAAVILATAGHTVLRASSR